MSFKKISLSMFISIFIISIFQISVKNEINVLSSEIHLINEKINYYEKELQQLEAKHHNLYSPKKLFELAKELNFVRVEKQVERTNLLQPYDMSKLKEIRPEFFGFSK
tara:strand:- start:78 stop:401 length:324 start_codon:yes stop_codon:yes gene_type:complete